MMRRTKVGDLVYVRFRVEGAFVDHRDGLTIRLTPVLSTGAPVREGLEHYFYDESLLIHRDDAIKGVRRLIQMEVIA